MYVRNLVLFLSSWPGLLCRPALAEDRGFESRGGVRFTHMTLRIAMLFFVTLFALLLWWVVDRNT
jgi:hypothetical protein